MRIALLSTSPWLAAHAGTLPPLPIPCPSGTCGGVSSFATYGSASYSQAGTRATINQTSTNAILNWQSFDIASGYSVQFVQPSASSVALNEIYDSNPTQILGALNANGRVFLINQNGIIFGAGAQVNVGGLVASTLAITQPAAVTSGSNAGIAGLTVPAQTGSGEAAFQAVTDSSGNVLSKNITVEQGATLQAASGGEIYLFAPNVNNLGTIQTPGGQTILAAGTSVYLAAAATDDPNLRGMLVEVDGNGTVTNGLASNANASSPQQLVGQILAEDGNISLAALAVNQYGRVNATTSVTENGSIYLEARNGTISVNSSIPQDTPGAGGTLVLGQNSDTEVTLDTSAPTETADSVPQLPSTIMMSGEKIDLLQGSVARATGGVIDVYADTNLGGLQGQLGTSNPDTGLAGLTYSSDGSQVYMAPGSVLDVSGADITLPVSDDVITAQLEATELADNPLGRNGPLHGQTISFDIRSHGTNADGSMWWGTPVANVTGEILAMERNVVERNLDGGTVNIQSQGSVIQAPGSKIDVAGGYIQYTGGYLSTSDLMTLWGQTVPVGAASPDVPYAGVVTDITATDTKWGVTNTYQANTSYYSPGYVEGKDAGTLAISAPNFILDGSVSASTVVGPYQTQPTTAHDSSTWVQNTSPAGIVTYSMYRPYDEVPAGATLEIGSSGGTAQSDHVVDDDIDIVSGEVLAGLKNADGSAYDPLTDPLPAGFSSTILQPGLLNAFQNVEIYTDGNLLESAGTAVSLAAGGSFVAQATNIDIQGSIDIPSGTISLTAEPNYVHPVGPDNLTLGAGGSLTARGAWINDNTALYPDGNTAALYINGGTVSLAATNTAGGVLGSGAASADLTLAPGSLIDVSGGAQLTSGGTLNAGTGGDISIQGGTPAKDVANADGGALPPDLELGATLQAYGLYEGGTLSVSAAGVCIAAGDCSGGKPSVVWLSPQFFDTGGFSDYKIAGDQEGLSIAPGTHLGLVQQNFVLPSGYTQLPNQATLVGTATTAELPVQIREPVSLSLALNYPTTSYVPTASGSVFPELDSASSPSLVIPQSVVISTEPGDTVGGTIALTSDTRIDVEGVLQAPAGNISLQLDLPAGLSLTGYDPTGGIWLGSTAVLDASGATKIFPNSSGIPTGSVLAGGSVSLDAANGYLELLPGSVIDVDGVSGVLDVGPVGGALTEAQRIASAGGTIDLSSSYGAVIGGTLLASAGSAGGGANQPEGGSLYVSENTTSNVAGAPSTSDIEVTSTLAPTVVAPGSAVPGALEGLTLLPTSALSQAGFSLVSLQSVVPFNSPQTYTAPGEIDFQGGATLTASAEVSLDAAVYDVEQGTTANIDAPYVEFGNSYDYTNLPLSLQLPLTTGGAGALNVAGSFIELYGTSWLQGIGTANFDSSGDLRLRGIQYGNSGATSNPAGTIGGALLADGTVSLTAQQIYPTTLTQFAIAADPQAVFPGGDPSSYSFSAASPPTSGSIVIHGSEGSNTDLLSAGGSMTLIAASITQDGVLRAPFGTIALDANSLTLGPGSLTSTSADGLTIPFGTTQGNTGGGAQTSYDWTYPLLGITAVYGTGPGDLPPPSQLVELNGTNVNVRTEAVIDVSGGGDLQAYEWVPGTGGTQDVLGCGDCYAIIPSLKANVAPYDPAMSATSSVQVGDAVYLSAGSGVPAGTYILLPARYALLPGAYLVTPMTGTAYQDMQPGQTFTAPDGGTIVSGYLTATGLPFGSSRLNGFEVAPASIFLNESQYNLSTGNQFFSAQNAEAASAANAADEAVSAMRLPQDAGVLDIDAGSSLTLDGTMSASVSGNARGAEVDISNPDIVVAANTGGVSQPGALVVTTSSLDQLGAQTLLLGGEDGDGVITTTAQNITILDGVSLSAPQLLLTAQQQISVQSGASLTAAGSAPSSGTAYTLNGSGAFLSVSAGPQITVTATGASSQGALDLAAGSSLSAKGGSIYLDATAGISTQGGIDATGGSLAVQAPQIALGSVAGSSGTAVLGQNVLGTGGLSNLLLVSAAPIVLGQGASADVQNITIDAPGLVAQSASGQSVILNATDTLTLGNPQGAAAVSSTGSQSGTLTLSASNITLEGVVPATDATTPETTDATPPSFDIEGFSTVALDAQNTVTAASDISFSTDGALSIAASRITAAAGVSASVTAAGNLTMISPSKPAKMPAATALGGQLQIVASNITVDTLLALPSGNVSLQATGMGGGVTLGSGGSIDVAGTAQQYGPDSLVTPGGTVTLSAGPSGSIDLASGSSIDVSAGSGVTAGSLSISAPTGDVTLGAQASLSGAGAEQGGSLSIDAQSFDFSAVSGAAEAGGFTSSQSYRLRGSAAAPMLLASGDTIQASNVMLESDSGAIDIEGTIDASGSAGGNVTLAAASGITLGAGALIDAHAKSAGQNGGTVELDIEDPDSPLQLNGRIDVAGGGLSETADGAGATAVLPGNGGTVLLRLPAQTVADAAAGGGEISLDGSIQGASSTVLEAYQVVMNQTGDLDITSTVLSNNLLPAMQTAANTIVGYQTPLMAQLAASGELNQATAAGWGSMALDPGIEIDASGDITLDTPWDLSGLRFSEASGTTGGTIEVPGILTLRASGNVTFNDSLSDGFTNPTSKVLISPGSGSWSYRIVAGADSTAANPLAVMSNPGGAEPGDVVIGSSSSQGVLVRTGTGFIDVAASRDFVLGNATSVLYTAGALDETDTPPTDAQSGLSLTPYSSDGGNINIDAGLDIVGAANTDQFVNAWTWRVGTQSSTGQTVSAWSINFKQFQEGVGALGGGNVTVQAGGDVTDFSASVASIGVASPDLSGVEVENGGRLAVSAGNDILGGTYYVGLGGMELTAGRDVGASPNTGLAPLIGLGDASVSVTAGRNLSVSDIVSPTLLNIGASEYSSGYDPSYFSSYGASSSGTLLAIGGSVELSDPSAIEAQYAVSFAGGDIGPPDNSDTVGDDTVGLVILPPVLGVYSPSGNVDIARDITEFPSSQDSLQVLAGENITMEPDAQVVVPDADPATLPSVAAPVFGSGSGVLGALVQIASPFSLSSAEQHGSSPLFGSVSAFDENPVTLVALNGDVTEAGTIGAEGLWSGKPVIVSAGQDVVDLNLVAQNITAGDVTSITAGGDVIYSESRSATGLLLPNSNGISVAGPGEVQVSAGGNVDLGTSNGIVTVGNEQNVVLPSSGASISVEAGVGASSATSAQYTAFIQQYIDGSSQFDGQLVTYVEQVTGQSGLTDNEAKQAFNGLAPQQQRTFLEQIFFTLLQTYGVDAAKSGNNADFAGAYAAIQTLFPGANPDLSKNQADPYTGSISLYFSNIYTEDGGDISLLAPGGEVNVGLAVPPSNFGGTLSGKTLGVVAERTGSVSSFSYGDFLVNESRVFAADGGNILVWSTEGNIDAGRGSKTSLSASLPTITYDDNGFANVTYFPPTSGSGIQALADTPGTSPGNVDLFAPHGVVNASEAGIVAGNLTIAATAVLGTNNISVSGVEVGVPVQVTGLGAQSLAASSTAAGAVSSAQSSVGQASQQSQQEAPQAAAELRWLDVFVLGFGEQTCSANDLACLKRQKHLAQ